MAKKLRYNDDNRDVLKRYLEAGGEGSGIELTSLQRELLSRWRYADELLRKNIFLMGRMEAIANSIQVKYNVSRDTAYRDIVNAKEVFLSLTPLNRKYEMQSRIEYLKSQIEVLFRTGCYDQAIAAEKILFSYIEKYPDTSTPRSPKTINLVLNQLVLQNDAMSVDEAWQEADVVLKQMIEGDDDR